MVDGPPARQFSGKRAASSIDARVMDGLLDYMTFAIILLMLISRMAWMPSCVEITATFAMAASLLGFAHRDAKDESPGVFRGFRSCSNLSMIYAIHFSTHKHLDNGGSTLCIDHADGVADLGVVPPTSHQCTMRASF